MSVGNPSSKAPRALRAISASNVAIEASVPSRTGRVIALFDVVAYLQVDGPRLVALTASNVPLGPFSIRLDTPEPDFPRWLDVESPIVFGESVIRAGETTVDLGSLAGWDPLPPWGVLSGQPRALAAALPRITDALGQHAPPGSLASLVGVSGTLPGAGRIQDALLAQAERCAAEFEAALGEFLRSDEVGAVEAAAARLAGLGGGFTPAGDDFLMGSMYAAWAILPPETARALSGAVGRAAAHLTTTVSGAYLQAAAQGAASEPWHLLVESILGSRGPAIEAAVETLCKIGHTSGADALAGFVRSGATLGLSA